MKCLQKLRELLLSLVDCIPPPFECFLRNAAHIAVASSVILALGATAVVNKAGALPKLLQSTFRIGFPFLACAVAGCTNLILVRKEELENGIQLFDENKDIPYNSLHDNFFEFEIITLHNTDIL